MAIRVNGDYAKLDFYLFDWDLSQRRLLPISVHTAKMFPEVIPPGYVVKPLGVGLNPQLYRGDDEPCLIVPKPVSMTVSPTKIVRANPNSGKPSPYPPQTPARLQQIVFALLNN